MHSFEPCALPFVHAGGRAGSCVPASDNTSDFARHWCPTELDEAGYPSGTGDWRRPCTDTCRQATFVAAPSAICGETACSDAGTSGENLKLEVRPPP